MANLADYEYKVTYLAYMMATAFVRIADNSILYANDNEDNVRFYAQAFCSGAHKTFYIE